MRDQVIRHVQRWLLLGVAVLVACKPQDGREAGSGRTDARSADRPTPPAQATVVEAVSEKSQEIRAWSARLIQREHGPENSDAIMLDVLIVDSSGNERLLAKDIVGPLLVFEDERTILSCESNDIMAAARPIVFDLSGQKTDGSEHPGFLRDCGRIQGSSLAFLHYNLVRDNGMPYNLIRIVDAYGKVVLEKERLGAGEVEIRVGERTYRVRVSEPEFPG